MNCKHVHWLDCTDRCRQDQKTFVLRMHSRTHHSGLRMADDLIRRLEGYRDLRKLEIQVRSEEQTIRIRTLEAEVATLKSELEEYRSM